MTHPVSTYIFVIIISVVLLVTSDIPFANAAEETLINELRSKIEDRSERIDEIEKEIAQYKKDLDVIGGEKATLQNTIKTLEISKSKLEADIRVTQNRIDATGLQIERLALEIANKESSITLHTQTLAESIRRIDEAESNTFVESLLLYDNLSELWENVENLQQFQVVVEKNLKELRELKADLESNRDEREERKRSLVNYEYSLGNQRVAVIENREEKDSLLKQTQNKESNYQKLLEEKIEARKKFEQELLDFQSQLKTIIDPGSFPSSQSGLLTWPLDSVYITQHFGNTAFAQSGAYNGNGHNGIDFRAAPGTEIRTVLGGTVLATGNTDAFLNCYSYGKWILIRHNNGLSSLYAHLSVINVSQGTQVVTGQVIGYSGSTGYATGPHLHLTLFVTQGVQLVKFGDIKARTNCANATVPVAPLNAYLNPLDYLPALQ